eukprot:TRINITY_DN29624_c0_g1_i1.p1 TRINITY_DN29624_c0_g1~~TRINITY_DN29624_c0_g1_i1.p1  ORF type:complete len:652 (-),score=157.83 TRINITY_DN29624_c0_g1_i1:50-2005(-)
MGKKRKTAPQATVGGAKRLREGVFDISLQHGGKPLCPSLAEVQSLLLGLFSGDHSKTQSWVRVGNASLLQRVVVAVAPCADLQTLREHSTDAPFLSRLLLNQHKLFPMRHSSPPPISADKSCPLICALLSMSSQTSGKQTKPVAAGVSPIESFVATREQLSRSGYPLEEQLGWVRAQARTGAEVAEKSAPPAQNVIAAAATVDDADGWTQVASKKRRGKQTSAQNMVDKDRRHLMALDCEMVQTASGLRLARVAVINADLEVLYDSLVRPDEEIVDYLTQYSGISKSMMEGVTTKLEDVQRSLLELITTDTILVGHSLENDLLALRLLHSRIIDTALLYPHPQGWPHRSSLRFLAKQHLRKQLERESGHDPIADAKAAMELALLKFVRGPTFGDLPGGSGDVKPLGKLLRSADSSASLTVIDRGSCLDGRSWHLGGCGVRAVDDDSSAARAVLASALPQELDSVAQDVSADASKIATADVAAAEDASASAVKTATAGAAAATSDAAVSAADAATAPGAVVKEAVAGRSVDLVVFREVQELCHRHARDDQRPARLFAGALAALDARLRELAGALAEDVLLCVLTVCGDSPRYFELQKRKAKAKEGAAKGEGDAAPWTQALERELEQAKLRRESPFGALVMCGPGALGPLLSS